MVRFQDQLWPKYFDPLMTPAPVLELPAGVQLLYLAEGGANIVYRMLLPPVDLTSSEVEHYGNGTPPPTEIEDYDPADPFEGKLLRLRKDVKYGIPYEDTARNFDKVLRSQFGPEELVDQRLVRLPAGLVHFCNEQLRASERTGRRPVKRHGVYLSTTEPFGLLITDMTEANHLGSTVAEFKPKWLLQSPSAPSNAKRCRTCALREMKNHKAHKAGLKEERSFCPLDLVSGKMEDVARAVRFIKGCPDKNRLTRTLYRNSTLLKLREYQESRNDVGLAGHPANSTDMSLGMTLRDCTMFIKVRTPPFSLFQPHGGLPSNGMARLTDPVDARRRKRARGSAPG
jgi:inositol-pentakisphosphate 2-kinase